MDFQSELEYRIRKALDAIPYCKTRSEAEEIQAEIAELEEQLSACPACGSFETEYDDDNLECGNEFHKENY